MQRVFFLFLFIYFFNEDKPFDNVVINCNPCPPLTRDREVLPRDSILYFVMSKVQPQVLPETVGDIFLENTQVGPRRITQGDFGQSPGICGHPGVVDFQPF